MSSARVSVAEENAGDTWSTLQFLAGKSLEDNVVPRDLAFKTQQLSSATVSIRLKNGRRERGGRCLTAQGGTTRRQTSTD